MVVLSISDYYNRMRIISDELKNVYGGLLGQYTQNTFEIFSSFEFIVDDSLNLDLAYIEERRKLSEQLNPNYELVGFYIAAPECAPDFSKNENIFKGMGALGVFSPLCLYLCTDIDDLDTLPLSVFEIDKTNLNFISLEYAIEGNESERICLDSVVKSSDALDNESGIVQNLNTFKNAADVLKSKLNVILEALNEEKYLNDPVFVSMFEDLVSNFPDSSNPDLIKTLKDNIEESMVLSNICADTACLSLLENIDLNSRKLENFNDIFDK